MYRIPLLVLITAGLVAASVFPGACWDVEGVYIGGFAAGDTSLALTSAGLPIISYAAENDLYVATKILGGWASEAVAPCGFFGGWSSLAINGLGLPCVAFIDSSENGNYLKYAYKSGLGWLVETVDDVGWLPDRVSLAFNSSGQACIAYCRTTADYPFRTYITFARRTGTSLWNKQDIAEVADVTAPALIIASGDAYRVTFCDVGTGQLKSAYRVGAVSPWQTQTIDGDSDTPALGCPAVALQPNGAPAVAYFVKQGSDLVLKYAVYGSGWASETITSMPYDGLCHCSLGVRRSGAPVIAFHDADSGSFMCARKTAAGWVREPIDAAPQTGLRPSLQLDSFGNAHVSYFDNTNYDVMYAWSSTPIPDAKLLADGESVEILGAAASSASGELGPRIYVQDPDRTSGIQLYFTGAVPAVTRGMILDIQGTLTTVDGERAVLDPTVQEIGFPVVIAPLGLTNRALGGGDLGYPVWPAGQHGVTGASGLNNIGLLVRTWGAFRYVDTSTFTLDDGSGMSVKCVVPAGVTLNPAWRYVCVTGISSCEFSGADLVRLLRVRGEGDVVVLR